jgi:hypothetical protein
MHEKNKIHLYEYSYYLEGIYYKWFNELTSDMEVHSILVRCFDNIEDIKKIMLLNIRHSNKSFRKLCIDIINGVEYEWIDHR